MGLRILERQPLNSGYKLSQQSNFICKTMTLNSKVIIMYSFLFISHGISASSKNLDFEHIAIQRDNTVALGKKIVRVSVWASCKINFFSLIPITSIQTAALIFPALFSAMHPYWPASLRVTLSMVRVLFLTI